MEFNTKAAKSSIDSRVGRVLKKQAIETTTNLAGVEREVNNI